MGRYIPRNEAAIREYADLIRAVYAGQRREIGEADIRAKAVDMFMANGSLADLSARLEEENKNLQEASKIPAKIWHEQMTV